MLLLNQIFKWIVSVTGIGSLLIVFMIIFRKLFKEKVESRFLNLLWVLILIKLVVPIDVKSTFSLDRVLSIDKQAILNETREDDIEKLEKNILDYNKNINNDKINNIIIENKNETINKQIDNKVKTDRSFNFKDNLIYIWGLGAMLVWIILIYTRIRLSREINKSKIVKDKKVLDIFNESKKLLNIKRNIDIHRGYKKSSPFIIGLIKPKIYLSEDILGELNGEQISHILLHELSHYKRGDIFFNTLQTIALIFHWFNPLVWISMQLIKTDRELACDDYVMDVLGEECTIDYGYTLIELSRFSSFNKNNLVSIHFADDNNQTKRRVEMVKKYEGMSKGKKLVMVVTVLLIGIFILTNYKEKAFDKSFALKESDDSQVIVETKNRSYYDMKEKFEDINEEIKIPDPYVAGLRFLKVEFSENNDRISMYYSESPDKYHRGFSKVNTYIYTISKDELPLVNRKYRGPDFNKEDYEEADVLEEDIEILKDENKIIAGKKINSVTYEFSYMDSDLYAIENQYNWEDDGLHYQLIRSESDNPRDGDIQRNSNSKDRFINTFEINDNRLKQILESVEPIIEKSSTYYKAIGAKNWKDKVYTENDLEKIFEKMKYEIDFPRELIDKYNVIDIEANNHTFIEKENSDEIINHGLRIEYDNNISLLVNTWEGINYNIILDEYEGIIKRSPMGGVLEDESKILNIKGQDVHQFVRISKVEEGIYTGYPDGIGINEYFWESENGDLYLLLIPQVVGQLEYDWEDIADVSNDEQIKMVESIIELNK